MAPSPLLRFENHQSGGTKKRLLVALVLAGALGLYITQTPSEADDINDCRWEAASQLAEWARKATRKCTEWTTAAAGKVASCMTVRTGTPYSCSVAKASTQDPNALCEFPPQIESMEFICAPTINH